MENFTKSPVVQPNQTGTVALHDAVANTVRYYLSGGHGNSTDPLYDLVIKQAEKPVLEAVLRETKGNQSKAALMLGLSRGTLRKKIREHGISTALLAEETE
jgi:Fis family transcriptional regulator